MVLSDEKETKVKVDKENNSSKDNDAAVEAVVNNNVKPSEDGKYPNKDKKNKQKEKACIPTVNSEVIKKNKQKEKACIATVNSEVIKKNKQKEKACIPTVNS